MYLFAQQRVVVELEVLCDTSCVLASMIQEGFLACYEDRGICVGAAHSD